MHGLSCSTAHRIFQTRDQTLCPALAGGFLATGPSGKSCLLCLDQLHLSGVGRGYCMRDAFQTWCSVV